VRFVGFDPGGIDKFGWAVLESAPHSLQFVAAGRCTGVAAVMAEVSAALQNQQPAGVGIDAPLFWVQEADRAADRTVRRLVIGAGGDGRTVMAVNSLQGACLVQGVLVTMRAHKEWPDALITEAHPKALIRVCAAAAAFVNGIPELATPGFHEQDAVLGAYSAHALVTNAVADWHDLAARETAPYFPGGSAVAYWFPKRGNKAR
jgi:hypothetical protein